jgi:septum site-determining protein MinC
MENKNMDMMDMDMDMEKENNAEFLPIQLKGTNFGIKVILSGASSDDLLVEKLETIPEQAFILPMGTGVVLDFQSRPCSEELVGKMLSKVIWPKKLNVLAWTNADAESTERLERGGFKTATPVLEDAENAEKMKEAREAKALPLILEHSLRSGQHEEHPGDVVLLGHLNSGAEIFAGGSISVLGKLKGLVHAGRKGTEGVYILAGSFEPRQLRIGDRLCDQFGADMKWWKKPVIITLEVDGLFFRDWKLEIGNETI